MRDILTEFSWQRQKLGFWLVGTNNFYQNEMPTKIQSVDSRAQAMHLEDDLSKQVEPPGLPSAAAQAKYLVDDLSKQVEPLGPPTAAVASGHLRNQLAVRVSQTGPGMQVFTNHKKN